MAALLLLLNFLGTPVEAVSQPGHSSNARVEDIYIARSIRDSRVAPTGFCTERQIGFGNVTSEDRYTFRFTATRPSDGLMIDTNIETIGRLHACFGSTRGSDNSEFYAEALWQM